MQRAHKNYVAILLILTIYIAGENIITAQVQPEDTLFVLGNKYTVEYMRRKEAKEDIVKGNIYIIIPGWFYPRREVDSLANEYGFKFFLQGCTPVPGRNFYNDEVKKYLSKRNGKGWWKRFKEEEAKLKQ